MSPSYLKSEVTVVRTDVLNETGTFHSPILYTVLTRLQTFGSNQNGKKKGDGVLSFSSTEKSELGSYIYCI